MSAKSILQEAQAIVHGDRGADYGHPFYNHACTAVMVAAYLSRKYRREIAIDTDDICMINTLQKVSRQANRPKRDNLVDIAGYAENAQMCQDEKARLAAPAKKAPRKP